MKNQFILWVLLFALTSTLQAQGLDLEPEPRPFRASLVHPGTTKLGYGLEWRPYHRLSLAYVEKPPAYQKDTFCFEIEGCPNNQPDSPDNYTTTHDKGAQNLAIRLWFLKYFYVAAGILKSNGYSMVHKRLSSNGGSVNVGGRSVPEGNFIYQSTVPAAVTPSVGFGAQYIFPKTGILLWLGFNKSTMPHKGNATISTTSPNVTQEDLDYETSQNQISNQQSRLIMSVMTLGYSF